MTHTGIQATCACGNGGFKRAGAACAKSSQGGAAVVLQFPMPPLRQSRIEVAVTAPTTATGDAAALSQFSRKKLEALIEAGIAMLDAADGDPDLEDDDPSDGAVDDDGEDEPWNRDGVTLQLPCYGIDQTRGPTNEEEAVERWIADVQKLSSSPRPILRSVGL